MSKLTPILFIFYFTNYSQLIKYVIYFSLPYIGTELFIHKEFENILHTVVYLQQCSQPIRDSLLFTFQVLTMFSIQKLLNYYICSHFHNYIDGCKHNQPMVAKQYGSNNNKRKNGSNNTCEMKCAKLLHVCIFMYNNHLSSCTFN